MQTTAMTSSFSTFELEQYFAQHEFSAKYLCCSSDCETMTIGQLLEMENNRRKREESCGGLQSQEDKETDSLNELLNVSLGYMEPHGSPKLRSLIAQWFYNDHKTRHNKNDSTVHTIDSSNVLVHTGGVEPILLFILTCIPKDGHVIVQGPCYQALSEPANLKQVQQSFWQIKRRMDGSWYYDLQELESLIQPNTRAFIINPIHNPTGWTPSRLELEAIIALAKKHNIIIYSDEVYKCLEHNEQDRAIPHMCQLYDNCVSMNVMAKSFGLAGLRIGWIATRNATIFNNIAQGKDFTTICNSAPSEFLATVALRNKDEIHKVNTAIIQNNIVIADEFFCRYKHLFEWKPPSAGPICFVKYLGSEGARAFCDRVVQEAGVMLLPSDTYYYEDSYFRLGLGRRNFAEAIAHLDKYLSNAQPQQQ